jgi:GNAT superfamily N-acetyltransferase
MMSSASITKAFSSEVDAGSREENASNKDQSVGSDLSKPNRLEMLRQLELEDMDTAARVLRRSFDQALPSLAGLHTPEKDQWFFRERVFRTCEVWGAFDRAMMVGIIAFREHWIDQLYVLPKDQGRGVGTELLHVARSSFGRLHLWTFQRNVQARRFYEARGFALIRETDGAGNEEREPDALYLWARS